MEVARRGHSHTASSLAGEVLEKVVADAYRGTLAPVGMCFRTTAGASSFTTATGIPVFFFDAYSPWQRGTNENTNGLIRQYLPKSTDLNLTNTTRFEEIVTELNNRPRRALKWQTPHEVFNAAVIALTA